MIYTANRSAINESYSHADLSKILFESEVNDMAIFESALACDFNEVRGLQEGTILESEVRSLNEFSFKEMMDNVKKAADKFFNKILEAIRNAIAFIGNYVFNDGKKIVEKYKEYRKQYPDYTLSGTTKWINSSVTSMFPKLDLAKMKNDAKAYKDANEGSAAHEIMCKELAKISGKNVDSAKTFMKDMLSGAFVDAKINESLIASMCSVLETGKQPIKDLKKDEAEVRKNFKAYMSEMAKAEKEVKEGAVSANVIRNISKAYQDVITNVTKLNITLAKEELRLARRTLTGVMVSMTAKNKKSDVKTECAMSDSIFETYCTYIPGEGPVFESCSAEVKAIINGANY